MSNESHQMIKRSIPFCHHNQLEAASCSIIEGQIVTKPTETSCIRTSQRLNKIVLQPARPSAPAAVVSSDSLETLGPSIHHLWHDFCKKSWPLGASATVHNIEPSWRDKLCEKCNKCDSHENKL